MFWFVLPWLADGLGRNRGSKTICPVNHSLTYCCLIRFIMPGCHMKCHKDHVDREEACITMCNGKYKNAFTFLVFQVGEKLNHANFKKPWKVALKQVVINCEDGNSRSVLGSVEQLIASSYGLYPLKIVVCPYNKITEEGSSDFRIPRFFVLFCINGTNEFSSVDKMLMRLFWKYIFRKGQLKCMILQGTCSMTRVVLLPSAVLVDHEKNCFI